METSGGRVPATDPMGASIYRTLLAPAEIVRRVEVAHRPFHQLLDHAVAALRRDHGRVLLLDLHSFGMPLDSDVVIGDVHGTSASSDAVRAAERALRSVGFATARNARFPGGWIPRRFAATEDVDAVSIELNQRCYLNPPRCRRVADGPAILAATVSAARHRLRRAFQQIVLPSDQATGVSCGQSCVDHPEVPTTFLASDQISRWGSRRSAHSQ